MRRMLVLIAIMLTTASLAFAGGTNELVVAFPADPMKEKAFEDAAAAYTHLNPNVSIELLSIPAWEYEHAIVSRLNEDMPLDVIHVNPSLYVQISDRLLELTKYMVDNGYFDQMDGLYPAWFNLLASDGYFNDADNDPKEQLFQAPLRTGTTVLAYNKRMFDEANLDYPVDSWTWENDFLRAAKELTKKLDNGGQQWGISGVNDGYIHHAVVGAYGGQLFGLDENNEPRFFGSDESAVRGLDFLQNLIYEHEVAPRPEQQDGLGDTGFSMFREKRSAMYFLNTFEFPHLYGFDEEWDIAFLPAGPDGDSATTIYGERLAIPRSSRSPAHAWGFINLMNSAIGQNYLDTYYGFSDPALQSVAEKRIFFDGPVGAPEHNWIRTEALSKQPAIAVNPVIPNAPLVYHSLDSHLERIWMNDDPLSSMESAKAEIQPLLDAGF